MKYDLFFHKFGINILIQEISPPLLNFDIDLDIVLEILLIVMFEFVSDTICR